MNSGDTKLSFYNGLSGTMALVGFILTIFGILLFVSGFGRCTLNESRTTGTTTGLTLLLLFGILLFIAGLILWILNNKLNRPRNYAPHYTGCYADPNGTVLPVNYGKTNPKDCLDAAIKTRSHFFGLANWDKDTSTGTCYVSGEKGSMPTGLKTSSNCIFLPNNRALSWTGYPRNNVFVGQKNNIAILHI